MYGAYLDREFAFLKSVARVAAGICVSGLMLVPWKLAAAANWVQVGPSPTIMTSFPQPSTNVVGIGNNPVSGATNVVLQSPTDPDVLFAGTVNGGVWRSNDGGLNWTPLGDNLASLSVGAMAFDASDPTKLWIGFGKSSSMMTIGGAQTGVIQLNTVTGAWTAPGSNALLGKSVQRLYVDGTTMVVGIKSSANEPGVWRSTDGGATFSNHSTGLPNGNIASLARDPRNPSVFYAAVVLPGDPKGVYRSTDGGLTWTHLSSLPVATSGSADGRITHDIMLSVANDGTVVASVIDPIKTAAGLISENPRVTVYRSQDGGQAWTSMNQPGSVEHVPGKDPVFWGVYSAGQFNLHGALLVDPNDSTVVYISGDSQGPNELIGTGSGNSVGAGSYSGRIFRGRYDPMTGETVWEAITDAYTGNGSGPHADSRSLMIDSYGRLLQTDDGGIYVRTDPKSRQGVWHSLNGNLQVGEVHHARWNPLSHTVVTAMQDNGATIQMAAGNPTHAVASGGDGGIAAVNANWWVDGQRYAGAYVSSQFLGGSMRYRLDAYGRPVARTNLLFGTKVNGEFREFGEGSGALKPPRPRSPVTKQQAYEALTRPGLEPMSFYPAFALNAVDPTRLAVGAYDLYVGHDPMTEGDGEGLLIDMRKLTDVQSTSLGFISLAYGARGNANALLGGTGYESDLTAPGSLYYTPNVDAVAPQNIYTGTGIQAALFDRDRGVDRLYFSDGAAIHRASADGAGGFGFADISGNLPAGFFERRGLDHIFGNGVSALVAAGTHNVAGGNWLYTLRGPADAAAFVWDTRLGRIPNAPVFGLDYSPEDDVLLAYTLGRGAFALTDTTTYFPEALRLVFGKAGNSSAPGNDQLTDGETLGGVTFSRPLVKVGQGLLDLRGKAAGYSGGTDLDGGLVLVGANENLGEAGTGLRFNGGTLGFAAAFVMNRPIALGQGGGAFHTGGLPLVQGSQAIGGVGGLTVTGGGSYRFSTDNTYGGGTFIASAEVIAQRDGQLGAAGTGLRFDAGRLSLLPGFGLDASGVFRRPLTLEAGGGVIGTGDSDIPYTGTISGSGSLRFAGRPFRLVGQVHLNSGWEGALDIGAGSVLRGSGRVYGPLNVAGTVYPGNSPGTLTVFGPVTQMTGSTLALDIDGLGTGNGAGNYSRLLALGNTGSYMAAGSIVPVLRGMTGSATNRYTPALGHGFSVIQADAGVYGSFDSLVQPAEGLMAGSRFDTVYGANSVTLYATPAYYSQLDGLGVVSNGNRAQVGHVLDGLRPSAGVRAAGERKSLFDALAPVGATGLAKAMDQVAGVSHAQMLGAGFEVSSALSQRLTDSAAFSGWRGWTSSASSAPLAGEGVAWAQLLHSGSRLSGGEPGYGVNQSMDGFLAGVQRRLSDRTTTGLAFGYASGRQDVLDSMGGGRTNSWQIKAYGLHERGAWYAKGTAGLGVGEISSRRDLALGDINTRYRAEFATQSISLSGETGLRFGDRDSAHVSTWLGLDYLVDRHGSASDHGSGVAALDVSAGTLRSLRASAGVSAGVPFRVGKTDARMALRARVAHEMLDVTPSFDGRLLGAPFRVEGVAAGRTRVGVGAGLSAQLDKRMAFSADIMRETASRWGETSASVSLRISW